MSASANGVALVLGAAEGLGAAFSRACVARGQRTILVDHAPEPLAELAAELGPMGVPVHLDLASPDLAASIHRILSDHDVSLVIYNACYSRPGPFVSLDLADKLRTLDVNARGPLIACDRAARHLTARGEGGIILVSSLSALQGTAMVGTYAATKAFDLVLGETLWEELGPAGVDVLVVLAGAMYTPGFARVTPADRQRLALPMAPELVATGGLAALGRAGPTWIPGFTNRLAGGIGRLLTRGAAVRFFSRRTREMFEASTTGVDKGPT